MNASPSTRRAVLGTYYTIPEAERSLDRLGESVAARWDEASLRRHRVPMGGEEAWDPSCGKVPVLRLGAHDKIPAWWVQMVLDAGPCCSIGEVAARLEWHESTIRRHIVPRAGWEQGSGKVPGLRRGERWVVPVWWLERILGMAHEPPPDEAEQP
jgi:hypothetical protein